MTNPTDPHSPELKRNWHLVDLKDKILGREATRIAVLLIGKTKPQYRPHLDCGDYVVVVNAQEVKVTGKKKQQKMYYRHSGYPGGFKTRSFEEMLKESPTTIITHAVQGMLPKNKLRAPRLKRLKVFVGEKHPYADKLTPVPESPR